MKFILEDLQHISWETFSFLMFIHHWESFCMQLQVLSILVVKNQIFRTNMELKNNMQKISCYMRDSSFRWCIIENAKIFSWSCVKHFWNLSWVRNIEFQLVYANTFHQSPNCISWMKQNKAIARFSSKLYDKSLQSFKKIKEKLIAFI